jgi:hypothetical protein
MNRWENSNYYLRTFSPLLQAAVPRIARFDFSIAQTTSIFTTPLGLLPALPGLAYFPVWQNLIRQGSPYASQPGSLTIRWITSAGALFATMGSWTAGIGLLTNAGAKNSYIIGPAGVGGADASDTNGIGNRALQFGSGVADPTVSVAFPGSPVTLLFCYFLIPTYAEVAGGPTTPLR